MKALIFGITGQDGSYLTEYLLNLGYEVFGMVRRNSIPEHQSSRLDHIFKSIKTIYGDITDFGSVDNIIKRVEPDEIYNLAAMSHVRISFDIPKYTLETNTLGVLNVLESARKLSHVKIYQASSSEQFGNSFDLDKKQRETTPMHPVSPYGCSKLCSYSLIKNYRNAYNMFASNGILFNHESPRRGTNFVTSKIVQGAVLIKKGLTKELILGNLDASRDWGHAKDYCRAMHMILNHKEPDDFVVSTGITHTVREFCEITFKKLDMNYKDYIKQDERYIRPEELTYLCGDSSKIRQTLGWKPEYSFEDIIDEMVDYWMNK